MELSDYYHRIQATSGHSVTVYDRSHHEAGATPIGTVNAGPNGMEVFRPHYSLADRSAARVPGEFKTIGDGVMALIADYEGTRTTKFKREK